jgi:hypothetical protein
LIGLVDQFVELIFAVILDQLGDLILLLLLFTIKILMLQAAYGAMCPIGIAPPSAAGFILYIYGN